jgi:hypothetical protein
MKSADIQFKELLTKLLQKNLDPKNVLWVVPKPLVSMLHMTIQLNVQTLHS